MFEGNKVKKRKEKKKIPKLKPSVNILGRIWKAEMCIYTKGFAQTISIPASNI